MKRILTNAQIKSLKPSDKARKVVDGGGLYISVSPSGAKLWRYKYRIDGKEHVFSLGRYPDVSLAEARETHDVARALVQRGIHPLKERQRALAAQKLEPQSSFEAVALQWIAIGTQRWSAYYLHQVQSTLARDVFPHIGASRISEVSAGDVRAILQAVALRTAPPDGRRDRGRGAVNVAINIRMWIGSIFRFAASHGHAAVDPTPGLRQLLQRPKVKHHSYLQENELPAFMAALEGSRSARWTRIAVELLLLTFVRTGELRHAEWAEFDLENSTWRIPASRMKMRRMHVVPLSQAAVLRIRELWDMRDSDRFLFPNQRTPGAVMTATTINRLLERMGYGGRLSGHGFRATASTALNERGFSSRLIEKQLAHERGNRIELAYNHAEYMDERRAMMEAWAKIVFDNS